MISPDLSNLCWLLDLAERIQPVLPYEAAQFKDLAKNGNVREAKELYAKVADILRKELEAASDGRAASGQGEEPGNSDEPVTPSTRLEKARKRAVRKTAGESRPPTRSASGY